MTAAERIAEARKQYPADKYDLIFDESGHIVAATSKVSPSDTAWPYSRQCDLKENKCPKI